MQTKFQNSRRSDSVSRTVGVVLAVVALRAAAPGHAQDASTQRTFKTPEDAVETLLIAFKNVDDRALLDIFGAEHEKLIAVTDQVAKREALEELCTAADEWQQLREEGDDKRILVLGSKRWPFPIPLVREGGVWHFDTAAGAEEILNRRIGYNELEAIDACRAYVSAQLEYAREDRDGDDVREFAQRIRSTPGKRDGLYWEVPADSDEPLSPLGPFMADAAAYIAAGQKSHKPIPYRGYFYKILRRQGANPPVGKYDYVINGHMIAGFALVAWPADYGSSGIMTFVISHQGKLYQKDLGEKTAEIASDMEEYNPDQTWALVEE